MPHLLPYLRSVVGASWRVLVWGVYVPGPWALSRAVSVGWWWRFLGSPASWAPLLTRAASACGSGLRCLRRWLLVPPWFPWGLPCRVAYVGWGLARLAAVYTTMRAHLCVRCGFSVRAGGARNECSLSTLCTSPPRHIHSGTFFALDRKKKKKKDTRSACCKTSTSCSCSAGTEPARLQSLQIFQLAGGN